MIRLAALAAVLLAGGCADHSTQPDHIAATRELKASVPLPYTFVVDSLRLYEDGSACIEYSSSAGEGKAFFDGSRTLTDRDPQFGRSWARTCSQQGKELKALWVQGAW